MTPAHTTTVPPNDGARAPTDGGLLLRGLDGANPLGFLAALGTLRAFTRAQPDAGIRMSWEPADGGWRPALHASTTNQADVVAALLTQCKAASKHRTLGISDNLTVKPEDFRAHSMELLASDDRDATTYVAAFGCDMISEIKPPKGSLITDTALRTMSGAGHQHFLKTMRVVLDETTEEHLRKTIFHVWRYDDPMQNLNLRFDPVDDKRYALQWQDPSQPQTRKKNGNMLGANALAILGIPLLISAPVRGSLGTTGFRGWSAINTFWTWPIWEYPASTDVVSSLLSLKELQANKPNGETLRRMGVGAVFSAQRVTIGNYRNFTPARCIA